MGDYQPSQYETVAASQTDQVLGRGAGAKGDYLYALVIVVATSATSTVAVDDGGGSDIVIMAANTPIGTYFIPLMMKSSVGGWRVTTGAGATVIGLGDFT
jgi:hypothetical protein